jgi:hypothetical protein
MSSEERSLRDRAGTKTNFYSAPLTNMISRAWPTIPGTQMLELQGSAVGHNCRLVVTGGTKQHHCVEWGE